MLVLCLKGSQKSLAMVSFLNNTAIEEGGAVYLQDKSIITLYIIKKNVKYFLKAIKRTLHGGAIYHSNSNITFTGRSNVTFDNNNAAFQGGAVYSLYSSYVKIQEGSSVYFTMNAADIGGAMHTTLSSHVIVQ